MPYSVVFVTALALVVNCQSSWSEDGDDLVSSVEVEAVLGRTATLPCNVEPDFKEDRVYMVLWFRHSGGKPIYSFDVRGRSFNKALHWSDPLAFGRRAYFVTLSSPATLTIDSVQLDDEGLYRCRVDFKNSPTRNFQIRLVIIVPPHQLLLYDEKGKDAAGVAGPLEEGEDLTLICELRGGRPQPTLQWQVNNKRWEEHRILKNDGQTTVSELKIRNVDRSWLNATIKCQATNTALLSPHERSARLEMNLRPLSVEIEGREQRLGAARSTTLRCVARGSRPPAHLSWHRGNGRPPRGKVTEEFSDSHSVSTLELAAQPEDHGSQLRCRAENPALPDTALEDAFTMDVVYKPVVTMALGSTLNANDIKEGDDVYFECNIKANPKEHRISWFHNDQVVSQNISSGVFISTKSLVVQRVSRRDSGLYSCRAANSIGESSSRPVYLRVQYAPVCVHSTPLVVGARIEEALRLKCSVHADPADVSFVWQFNNSGESFKVSPARYVSVGGTSSELRYRAASERDYGALLCRAANSVGTQSRPCVFQVVPAARPSPPRNCSVQVQKGDVPLTVHCLAGYDGGLAQHFTLESTSGGPPRLLMNATTSLADFSVRFEVSRLQLLSAQGTRLQVVSRNSKGASDPVLLDYVVVQEAEKRTENVTKAVARFPTAAILAIVAALLASIGAAVTLSLRRRDASSRGGKRPAQSVVQMDAQGRPYVIAYPPAPDSKPLPPPIAADVKPDILNPKPDMEPPRVVLESAENKTYSLRNQEASTEVFDPYAANRMVGIR